jgi:hypothetical protein
MAVLAPSVGDLLDRHRAQLHLDATWLTSATLRMMKRDLLAQQASLLKRGDVTSYDKAVAAAGSVRFVLALIDSRRAYEENRR